MHMSFLRQILQSTGRLLRQASVACADFSRDPLAHPTLDGMSLTQLADLPAGELRASGRV